MVVTAKGYKKVKSADIASISKNKKDLGIIQNIKCDCVCIWILDTNYSSSFPIRGKTKFIEEIDALWTLNKMKQLLGQLMVYLIWKQ